MNFQRVFWFVTVATIAWAFLMLVKASRFDRGAGTRPSECVFLSGNPLLDLQLSNSSVCFQQIIAEGDHAENEAVAQENTDLDFAFIVLYSAMFLTFALLYRNQGSTLVVVFISLAAICDVIENFRILAGLRHLNALPIDWEPPGLFSVAKWITFSFAVAGLARLVLPTTRLLATVLLTSAVFTIAGLSVPWFMKIAQVWFLVALVIVLVRYFPFLARRSPQLRQTHGD